MDVDAPGAAPDAGPALATATSFHPDSQATIIGNPDRAGQGQASVSMRQPSASPRDQSATSPYQAALPVPRSAAASVVVETSTLPADFFTGSQTATNAVREEGEGENAIPKGAARAWWGEAGGLPRRQGGQDSAPKSICASMAGGEGGLRGKEGTDDRAPACAQCPLHTRPPWRVPKAARLHHGNCSAGFFEDKAAEAKAKGEKPKTQAELTAVRLGFFLAPVDQRLPVGWWDRQQSSVVDAAPAML